MSDTTNLSSIQPLNPSDITPDMVVVDVRPHQDYDRSHYNGSVSLYFPQILMRRVIRKKNEPKSLDVFLIAESTVLKNRHDGVFIVLYDDNTFDINECSPSDPLRVFSEIFLLENVKFGFVKGGFQEIKSILPDMCVFTQFAPFAMLTQTTPKASPIEIESHKLPLNFFLGGFMAIGSEQNACDIELLNKHSITHILNVTTNETIEDVRTGREILQIPIVDTINQDILGYFVQAFEFIDAARENPNAKLLIHCHAGISRSVSFAIAYVMWKEHKSFEEAFAIIQKHRTCASPNLNFLGQLMIFGKFISPNVSVSEIIEKAKVYISTL